MPEKTQLFIADPCHEPWGNMQPNADGRFCGSCRKTVVDFTMMSDQEVLSWLTGAGRSVCGRFTNDQLNRKLSPKKTSKRRAWAVWWQFLLAGWLISSEAFAQTGTPKGPQIEHIDPVHPGLPAQKSANVKVVMGGVASAVTVKPIDELRIRIIDSAGDEPVPWASLRLGKGKEQHMADAGGWFSLSRREVRRARQIEVSAIGYASTLFNVEDIGKDEYVRVVRLHRAATDLPAATVVGYGWTKGKLTITCTQTTTVRDILQDTLAFIGLGKKPLTVYPNPVAKGASMTLSVQTGKPGNYLVQLFSNAGSLVESIRIEGVDGPRTQLMNVPASLAAGLYFIRLSHEQTGKVYTQKVEVM